MPSHRAPLEFVVQQHADDAALLRGTRSYVVSGPHVKLHQLLRLDDRLAAHLDGLSLAREVGAVLARSALETPGRGQVFAAAVLAIDGRDAAALDRVLALSEALPEGRRGVISAFGWVSASSLRGITRALLGSSNDFRRLVALAACAMHRVDAGGAVTAALDNGGPALRARALNVIGDRGHVHHLPACIESLADQDSRCQYEASRAAVLLGDRHEAIRTLADIAATPGPWRAAALGLTLKVHATGRARSVLNELSHDPSNLRLLIRAIGAAGDPHYIPWLIKRMDDPKLTRIAGESFSLIVGLDLAYLNLDQKPLQDVDDGPSEDPEGDDVAMDEDSGLPWPDPEKIEAWWQVNNHRFAPGKRYFMGEPPSLAHCFAVLKNGFQRQRLAAATYLCLLRPGTPLFNTAAPAWRQKRWLDAIGA